MLKRNCNTEKCASAMLPTATVILFGWLAYCLAVPLQNYTWTF